MLLIWGYQAETREIIVDKVIGAKRERRRGISRIGKKIIANPVGNNNPLRDRETNDFDAAGGNA